MIGLHDHEGYLKKYLNRVESSKYEIRSTKQYRSTNEQMTKTWFQAIGVFLVLVDDKG